MDEKHVRVWQAAVAGFLVAAIAYALDLRQLGQVEFAVIVGVGVAVVVLLIRFVTEHLQK